MPRKPRALSAGLTQRLEKCGRSAFSEPIRPHEARAILAALEHAEDNGLERAAVAVEGAPASYNRNDLAERIRMLKGKKP
jgi:hypothetical protein